MRKTPEQKRELLAECAIYDLGWSTHSHGDRKRAFIGSDLHPVAATPFLETWVAVLEAAKLHAATLAEARGA